LGTRTAGILSKKGKIQARNRLHLNPYYISRHGVIFNLELKRREMGERWFGVRGGGDGR